MLNFCASCEFLLLGFLSLNVDRETRIFKSFKAEFNVCLRAFLDLVRERRSTR